MTREMWSIKYVISVYMRDLMCEMVFSPVIIIRLSHCSRDWKCFKQARIINYGLYMSMSE